jgi:hypothetical protein
VTVLGIGMNYKQMSDATRVRISKVSKRSTSTGKDNARVLRLLGASKPLSPVCTRRALVSDASSIPAARLLGIAYLGPTSRRASPTVAGVAPCITLGTNIEPRYFEKDLATIVADACHQHGKLHPEFDTTRGN